MNIYIFEDVEQLTDRYHSGGGLVVVAKNEKHLRELIYNKKNISITNEEMQDVIVFPLKGKIASRIFIFPDAGCC